ncbi:hypothetical protein EZV62_012805 [Acer yangbiense]|uniref:DYW domain-containing protein n=1 Tax=Acer yangbiense TaxID=1000413 RepID=A0A5C7HZ91_9ROSI|nr:hypothetical protein EZV62_012805 [Acer yangbiense]
MKGDIDNGEMATRCVFELDPSNASPYIMLSNMYATCGRWEDVASLRSLMKSKNEAGFIPNAKYVLHDLKEEEKFESICYHSEKLVLAFGLIKKPQGGTAIRIMKNVRVCSDCHVFMKFVSKIMECPIILRDSNRFHHFVGGKCSCKDY